MSDSMCVKCQKFFGDPKKLAMCSMCYKQYAQEEGIKQEVQHFKMPDIPQVPQSRQQNHSRCFNCNKKIGLLGFRCKGCDCSYCNAHRMPQDHKCDCDFVEQAKEEIKKNNPNITAPKIQKI